MPDGSVMATSTRWDLPVSSVVKRMRAAKASRGTFTGIAFVWISFRIPMSDGLPSLAMMI